MKVRHWFKSRTILLCMGAATLLCLVCAVIYPVHYNASVSIPTGWYTLTKRNSLVKGEIIQLCLPPLIGKFAVSRGYVHRGRCTGGSRRIGKPVLAFAGDTVQVTTHGIQVNDGPHIDAPFQDRDRRGKLMPQVSGRLVLQDNECFLLSMHSPFSFDSRYYGPIPCHPPYQVMTQVK